MLSRPLRQSCPSLRRPRHRRVDSSGMVQLHFMDPTYPYYTATSTGQDHSSAQHHHQHLRGHQQIQTQAYTRSPDEASPTGHAYAYPPHPQVSPPVPGNYSSYPSPHHQHQHQHQHQQHQPQQGSTSYRSTPQGMSATLPPINQAQAYSRNGTQADRYDQGFVPSIGPTLQDLPFTTPRSSSAGHVSRNSGSWGPPPASSSRSQPHYTPRGMATSAYPPPRQGSQHPSLSHSTQLIPTPAQTAQTYHGYSSGSSSPGGSLPVVASIPPASGSVTPQERFYCDKCDKSFGRAHDKKRHYESAHLQTHHECRFCHKCFSRNDSLKRHQDNGCEKDPNFHS
ncbi:hypothetical protein BN946_scf185042.g79 [Trametes cinnabarina]|uniref:C2H2-type domain-containing protein n=1 Tax=Pycnoporus cinnabarinus TaxID=5643 RepID=A0A060S424_PYCCI|nr:hypothetical protein BN946_scf185042.g79 [Trametes cinnabarina]